jgi:hypothetical protein
MNKYKLIISNHERNEIRKKQNITEQNDQTMNFINKKFGSNTEEVFSDVMNTLLGNKKTSTIQSSSPEVSSSSEVKITEKGQKLLKDPLFKEKLSKISKEINIDENSIKKLMNLESGLNSQIKNNIGCVGLIQFCPDIPRSGYKTISGKKYNLEELRNNLSLQMDAILEFWKEGYRSGKIKEPKDLYLYNFIPRAAGKPDDYVLRTNTSSPEKVAKQNPIFNRTLGRPSGTPLTVGDMERYYRKTGMV